MLKEGKIGKSEAIVLLVTVITTKVFLAYPAVLVSYGGSAAWMIVLISGLVTLALLGFIIKFLERFPETSFPETVEKIAGPYLGIAIVLLAIVPWMIDLSATFRRFSELIIIVALPETPISLIMTTFAAASGIAAYLGIQTIARASYLAFPFALGAVFLIAALTYSSWNIDYLFPLLGKGTIEVVKNGILRSSDFAELNFLYFLPAILYSKQIKKIGIKSIVVSTLIFLVLVLSYILSFPAVVGEEPYLPLFMMARSVYFGRFFQRIEAIFVFFWVIGGYIWIAAGIYGFCHIIAELLKLPDYRPIILPTLIFLFSIALIPFSLPDAVLISNYAYREISFIPAFGLPALLLILAIIRGKGAKKGAKK